MQTYTRAPEQQATTEVVTAPAPHNYPAAHQYTTTAPAPHNYPAAHQYTTTAPPPHNYLPPTTYGGGGGGGGGGNGGDDTPPTGGYGGPEPHRYGKPRGRLIRQITLYIPSLRTAGQLLWVPVNEYIDRLMPGCEHDGIVRLGDGVYFGEASDFAELCDLGNGEGEGNEPLVGAPISGEHDTFTDDPAFEHDYQEEERSDAREVMIRVALALRTALAQDPTDVVGPLTTEDLKIIQRIAVGWQKDPLTHAQVLAAIRADPLSGLGAVALDFATWERAERYGTLGAQLHRLSDEYFSRSFRWRLLPMESFLIHSGSLPPNAERSPDGDYQLLGSYVVAKISYHSDLTGKVMGGWRSLYLEPFVPDNT